MRIILVSCFLLSTCSLALATEYTEGVYDPQPSTKEKRFIFNKSAQIQKLIQGLTAFSRVSNSNAGSKNIPLPAYHVKSAPAQTTTAAPPATPKPVTIAFPDNKPTTSAPGKGDNSFDRELDYLTQYHDNAYALPETAPRAGQPGQSKSTFDRLPPLPENQTSDVKQNSQTLALTSPQVYTYSQSYSTPLQYTSAGLNLGVQQVLPAAQPLITQYSSPQAYSQLYSTPQSYLPASQSHLPFLPAGAQTYLPQQHVIPAPQISPVTYQTQQQTHLSYVSPPQAPVATASLGYTQYQSLPNNQFAFSNQLLNSAHIQSAYFGNAHSTGAQCACKDYK